MKKLNKGHIKLCIVSSAGGHLAKTMKLKSWWGIYEHFFVSRDDELTREILAREKLITAFFPENRHAINLIRNFWVAWRVYCDQKPTHVFSMGAGVAIPFFLLAKLFGIKTIFMETFITIPRRTLTGKIVYYFSDQFVVQNEKMLRYYPAAHYWGSIVLR